MWEQVQETGHALAGGVELHFAPSCGCVLYNKVFETLIFLSSAGQHFINELSNLVPTRTHASAPDDY